ncbi:MAG: isochorismate synthase [Actinomycetota bacterium]
MSEPRGAHLGRVRTRRLGPAFDLLAGYGPGGVFIERSGVGVAGAGSAAGPWVRSVRRSASGELPLVLEELFGDIEFVPSETPAPPPLVFGSMPFDPDLPGTFVMPARAVRRDREGETWAIEVARPDGDSEPTPAPAASGSVGGSVSVAPREPFSDIQLVPEPAADAYVRAVRTAVERIRARELDKVVLARTLRVAAGRTLDPIRLVRRLRAVEPSGYAFAVDLGEERTLVGASPELLVSRFGREIRANPLAGSAPRFGDPDADRASAAALGSSAKDRQEHAIVVEEVFHVLHPLCTELTYDREPKLLATANVWHLSTRFRGRLRDPSTSALDLIAALHPTPAVCGAPRVEALDMIRELEPVPRGSYAGAVGWMDAMGDGVWVIALRCAELQGATARLYAGAGIVADSEPEAELDETERKFQAFLDALRWG